MKISFHFSNILTKMSLLFKSLRKADEYAKLQCSIELFFAEIRTTLVEEKRRKEESLMNKCWTTPEDFNNDLKNWFLLEAIHLSTCSKCGV